MLHCLALTRPVVLRAVIAGELREGEAVVVTLEFVNSAEYVLEGAAIVCWAPQSSRGSPWRLAAEGGAEEDAEGSRARAMAVGVAVAIHPMPRKKTRAAGATPTGPSGMTVYERISCRAL
mmetsp:Transcript_28428/g.71536  ORF Transcript_28428/g.71536 Transcript_28428/m.71536 type:complete len:120 (+) Transcript_28428:823-1182(+)